MSDSTGSEASFERRKRRLSALCWSATLSTLAVVALLSFVEIDVTPFVEMAERLDSSLAVSLVLLFAAVQAFRVLRFRWLLPSPVGYLQITAATLVHGFLASLLPWKLGEISLPLLLRREEVPLSESVAALLLARVLDLLIVAVLLGFSLMMFWRDLPNGLRHTWPVAALLSTLTLTALAGGFVFRRRLSGRLPSKIGRNAETVRLSDESSAAKAREFPCVDLNSWRRWFTVRFRDALEGTPALRLSRLVHVLILTSGLWGMAAAFNLLFCCGFAPDLPLGPAVVVVLIIPLVNQLPIRGLAGIGTTEAVAVVMFTSAGLSPAEALALGIWGHAFHFGMIAAGGLLGLGIRTTTGRGRLRDDTRGLLSPDTP